MGWNYIPKLQRCNHWMSKFISQFTGLCDYLSMLRLKASHIGKWGPDMFLFQTRPPGSQKWSQLLTHEGLSKFQSIYGTLDKTEIYLNSGLYWGGWWIDGYWCQTTNWTNVDLFHQWGHLVFTVSRIRSKMYQNICKTQMNKPGISTALVCTFSVITCKWMSLYKYLNGLLRKCGISSASAMEML